MAEYKVLITTSGIGSRLGDLTKYTNKSLVRVGDKPALSHIIDQYAKDVEFVVTLGHFGSHVKQYLEICYPDRVFTFVDVDDYSGPKSSLLYSISHCSNHLQQPFIFHACDTILSDEYYEKLNTLGSSNWILGCNSDTSHHYRTFNVRLSNVIYINEKGEQNFDYAYVGVAGIRDYKAFWSEVEKCLTVKTSDLSDCHVINSMIQKGCRFGFREIKTWLDIGNVDSLRVARSKIPSSYHVLDKNDENIYILNNHVFKFFANTSICKNRVMRFQHLNGLVPDLVAHTPNFYKYKYVNGDLLAESVNLTKFQSLLDWSNNKLWTNKQNPNHKSNCVQFYKTKTINRIKDFLTKYILEDKEETINGVLAPKLSDMLAKIDFEALSGETSTSYHGDFILDNILVHGNSFTLIDWRQDFNGDIENGDMYYDLAKLNHNLIVNHGMIKDNRFYVKFHENEIECDIDVKKSLIDCKQVLVDFCTNKNIDYKKIDILTSLIWINMAPLHEHPFDMFLYYFGKYNLSLRVK
jgi:NDP-sugar pyrophosphorylase family protein